MARADFRKSPVCGDGACVEVAYTTPSTCSDSACVEVGVADEAVLLRQTEHPEEILEFSPAAWMEFRAGVLNGEFDVE